MKKTFNVVSLFCGAGGLDMGFNRAGFKTIWANDNKRDACATFKRWNPDAEVVCADIKKIDAATIPRADVLLGGFPCQGFSVAGKQCAAIQTFPRSMEFEGNVPSKIEQIGNAVPPLLAEKIAARVYKTLTDNANA